MPSSQGSVVFALTSHGYGHLTRSLEVLGELMTLCPDAEFVVSGVAPQWMLEKQLPRPVTYRECRYEPGTAQKNCFEVDVEGTSSAYREFLAVHDARVDDEVEFLRRTGAVGVVVDVPALPVRAAARAGLPVVGVANFTWDWILEPIVPGDIVDAIRADYAAGDLLLALPLGPYCAESSAGPSVDVPFQRHEDAPLVARHARFPREEVLRRLGEDDPARPTVLVCVGGWGSGEWDEVRVDGCSDLRFVIVDELPVRFDGRAVRLPNELIGDLRFADLVAAADIVLTKPGYGIASECIANRTPILGIERRDFREAPYLVQGLAGAGPYAQLSLDEFFAGRWDEPLRRLLADRRPWADIPSDGARIVARRLAEFFALDLEE